MNLPTNLAVAIANLSLEADRVDFALAARRDGFDRPSYTCRTDGTDHLIATCRRAFDLSYNLKVED